jgi:pimeloyl-ACP methyl ester carboxylesterase/DNA-binding CsgD family transcriptional regulator
MRAHNGLNIAWSASGNGSPALVMVPAWFSHLAQDWQDDAGWFHQRLAERHRLIRYDRPGNGLADRDGHDFTLDGQVDALNRVIHDSGERRVALFAHGPGAATAIAYAVAHPDRVAHLVLFNATPRLLAAHDYPDGADPFLYSAVEQLIAADWTVASHTLCHLLAQGSTAEAVDRLAAYWCTSASARAASAYLRETMQIDVRHLLARVTTPTLVLHRRDDTFIGVNNAYRLAEAIKGSELRLIDGGAHFPWHGNRVAVVRLVLDFVGRKPLPLTTREMEIMRAVAAGLSNREVGHHLSITQHTVARHLSNVFLKLNVSSRVAALAELRAADVDWTEERPEPPRVVTPRESGRKGPDVGLRVS